MGIDLCSQITIISPRISFSHDLHPPDKPNQFEHRLDPSGLDSASDFDFCFAGAGPVQEPSPADELFSNGRILPIQIKKIPIPARQNRGSVPNSSLRRRTPPEKKMLKEFLSGADDDDGGESEDPSPARAYWRSSSLNCDGAGGGRGLIRSLHFLSRSNSTGSVPVRPVLQKQPSVSSRKSSSSSSSSSSHAYYPYRPALSRCGSQGGAAVRTSPVLNLPPPYISRVTVNLFGFGSIFCNGKFKNKKKK